MPDEHDELLEFLTLFAFIYPNLNDTFAYACADTEKIYLDVEQPFGFDSEGGPPYVSNGEVLVRIWREYGTAGMYAFVAKMRGMDVLPRLRSPEYEAAKEALEDWTYDPD